jgi:uncharacterized membrane protein
MKEKTIAIIITILLLIAGLILGIIFKNFNFNNLNTNSYNKFNFYRSDLNINGREVTETLYFHTDESYHTLFRTFDSPLSISENTKNSITIKSVSCNYGDPYFKLNNYCYYENDFSKSQECVPYTENNEYGCTFGNTYGFNSNSEYLISSKFTINPENLFLINGKYYIKFIAYGANNHHDLISGENLIIIGTNMHDSEYKSSDYVIIYIPYEGDSTGYNIIKKSDFEFGGEKIKKDSILYQIFVILMHLLPGLIFFLSWHYFGKELTEPDVPEQLSQIPNKRKPWEVAAYFNPPFSSIDSNFFSTLLLDFYRRKIIDIKIEEGFFKKDLLIKLNRKSQELDDPIEKEFLQILEKLNEICPERHIQNNYFNLNKAASNPFSSLTIRSMYTVFKKSLDEHGKKFIEKKGVVIFMILIIILIMISIFTGIFSLTILSFFSLFLISIISAFSSLLIKFKEDFYREYIEWQSFKKWLSYSPSMKEHGHKGVVFWEEFLVYATALGVSKKVLKELKQERIITEKQFNTFTNIHTATLSFASSGGGSGGFSGAGGGGVGGGGGGGR